MKKEKIESYVIWFLITLCLLNFIFLIYLVFSFHDFKNNYHEVDTKKVESITRSQVTSYQHPFPLESHENIEIYSECECKDIVFSDMSYSTPIFKYIPIKINNWTVSKDIQEKLYQKCKKWNVNYIQALAIMYAEGARNNQYAIHTNNNGTQDIGLMQINTCNTDVIQLLTNSSDIEWLKDIDTNLNCACYIIQRQEKYCPEVESLYDSLVVYNGGINTLKKIKSGEYSLEQESSLYAAKVISYMDALYNYYFYESNNKDI